MMLPAELAGEHDAKEQALALLEKVGLSHRIDHYPSHQDRPPDGSQLSQIREQLDIVPPRLAEAEPGIHDNAVLG